MTAVRPRPARVLALLALALLSGCGFPPPQTSAERDASQACDSEANRIYDAQNRAQLSERQENDTPFSGSTPRPLPSDGLSDKFAYDNMVSDCLKHSAAVPVTDQPSN